MGKVLKELDVWVWRYKRNPRDFSGLHMTAREPACDELLRCLDLLEAEGPAASRTILLRNLDPKDEAKVSGGQRFTDFRKLVIALKKPTEDLQQFYVGYSGSRAIFALTPGELHQLREGIEDVRQGHGDYCISPLLGKKPAGTLDRKSLDLWFWPCFGHHGPTK